jgi:GNAT superfamily N-acetyltransferase
MIFVALSEAADNGTLILVEGGLCRWYRRRDGIVVIREILTLPTHRRRGIGRRMLAEVIAVNPGRVLRAKCPTKYDSGNRFWLAMVFTLIETKDEVNTWQRPANP